MARLVVVGGGRMGEALVAGLLAGGWGDPSELVLVEKVEPRRQELGRRFSGVEVRMDPVAADGAVIAVKPDDVEAACRAVRGAGTGRVLSIAAGVRLAQLESWLAPGTPVVRAMPNTPALVGEGASAVAAGAAASAADLEWAEAILGAVGIVVRLPEAQLDAVTGLSGSGPAYVFYLAECLAEAGVAAGLPEELALRLARATVTGAGELLFESDLPAATLRENVTSPGGTTAAALKVLMTEPGGLRDLMREAVAAAKRRAQELAG